MFSARWRQAQAYAALLSGAAVTRGLVGPGERPRIWERHLLNCAAVAPECPPGARVCDVGSGAGLPGIPLALARADLQVTLLEPLLRRATFLQEVMQELDLANIMVVRQRAEQHGRAVPPPEYDVVTARAVAPLPRLAGWALPLCRSGGVLLALKGAAAERELVEATPVLRRLNAVSWDVRSYPIPGVAAPVVAVRVVAGAPRR